MKWRAMKLLGGGYLVYIAVRHLFFETREEVSESVSVTDEGDPVLLDAETGEELSPDHHGVEIDQRVPVDLPIRRDAASGKAPFWPTVLVIELTDIAFAVDSILAAIALVTGATHEQVQGSLHPKLWVVLLGGMLGVILMRFAAVMFIRLLERFPRFEEAAYLLVIVIGGKLLVDWYFNTPDHPHRVDFHTWTHPAFWVFWGLMLAAFLMGFSAVAAAAPRVVGRWLNSSDKELCLWLCRPFLASSVFCPTRDTPRAAPHGDRHGDRHGTAGSSWLRSRSWSVWSTRPIRNPSQPRPRKRLRCSTCGVARRWREPQFRHTAPSRRCCMRPRAT